MTGPTGAYVLMILGGIGVLLLLASAITNKFKEVVISFAVFLGAGVLGVVTHEESWVVLNIIGIVAMFALSARRLIKQMGFLLLAGVLMSGTAIIIFVYRAVMATFFGVGVAH